MRPTAVLDYEVDDGAPQREYPVDILCILCIERVELTADNKPILEDMVYYQWYEDALPGGGRHKYVPSARYVYLGDIYDLCTPEALNRPALLVPNLNPSPLNHYSRAAPRVGQFTRPCMFWLEEIQ